MSYKISDKDLRTIIDFGEGKGYPLSIRLISSLLTRVGVDPNRLSDKKLRDQLTDVYKYYESLKDGQKKPEEYEKPIRDYHKKDEPIWLLKAYLRSLNLPISEDLYEIREEARKHVYRTKKSKNKNRKTYAISPREIREQLIKLVGQEDGIVLLDKIDDICEYFPSICDSTVPDHYLNEKMELMRYDMDLFVLIASKVTTVPDQRLISSETARTFKISEWNPWVALLNELTVLDEAPTRGDVEDIIVFNFLIFDQNDTYHTLQDYKYVLSQSSAAAGKSTNLYSREYRRIVSEVRQEIPFTKVFVLRNALIKFYETYPVLSYLLLQKHATLPLAIVDNGHPSALNLIHDMKITKFAPLSHNQEVVNYMLRNATPDDIKLRLDKQKTPSLEMLRWLVSHSKDPKNLLDLVLQVDDVQSFQKMFDPRERKVSLASALFDHALNTTDSILSSMNNEELNKVDSKRLYDVIIDDIEEYGETLSLFPILIKYFTVKRFNDNKRDLLKLAIEKNRGDVVNYFVKTDADITTPVTSNSGYNSGSENEGSDISPLLYALNIRKSKFPIFDLLLPFYNVTPTRLLEDASNFDLVNAVRTLLETFDYSDDQLLSALLLAKSSVVNGLITKRLRIKPTPSGGVYERNETPGSNIDVPFRQNEPTPDKPGTLRRDEISQEEETSSFSSSED